MLTVSPRAQTAHLGNELMSQGLLVLFTLCSHPFPASSLGIREPTADARCETHPSLRGPTGDFLSCGVDSDFSLQRPQCAAASLSLALLTLLVNSSVPIISLSLLSSPPARPRHHPKPNNNWPFSQLMFTGM